MVGFTLSFPIIVVTSLFRETRKLVMARPQQQQICEFKTHKEWKDFEKELKKQVAESQRKSKETV
jgi:hypothetical protein|tara:strand:+ start:232 stop:426 length:195 start_codon:yes stop_codon:yes gene_type:complete